jgi:hypothetical protein
MSVQLICCTILKNGQDARSTKDKFSCGTGILPVHKRLIENGATYEYQTLKPTPLYSRKVYAYLSLLQGKDSKPPFLVTRLGPRICISGYLESKL